MDIEKLIEQGRRGDETALRGLYGTYYQRMARICQRIVGDCRIAEELSHDAFLLCLQASFHSSVAQATLRNSIGVKRSHTRVH